MSAAEPARSLLTFLSKFARTILCASLILAAASAAAAEASSNASTSLATTATQCNKSTLTSDEFLRTIRAIAMHGDLRDIPFIENAMQVKFSGGHPAYKGLEPNYHNISYETSLLPNANVAIRLHIHDDDKVTNSNELTFNGDYFTNCSPFSASQIEDAFGGGFTHKTLGTSSTGGEIFADVELPGVGKDGSHIHVNYVVPLTKTGADGIIPPPSIGQTKQ